MCKKKQNACPCAYCEHFNLIEYSRGNMIIQKGVCAKHNLFRELGDELCEDFILKIGVHTKKWYPKKKGM